MTVEGDTCNLRPAAPASRAFARVTGDTSCASRALAFALPSEETCILPAFGRAPSTNSTRPDPTGLKLYSGGERGMSRIGPSHPERTESS